MSQAGETLDLNDPEVELTLEQKIELAVQAVRQLSVARDTDEMVRGFEKSTRWQRRSDRWVAVSRRDLSDGWYRVTRSSSWTEKINPWKQRDRLPLLRGGMVADILYSDRPRIINDLPSVLKPDDPAYEYLQDAGSMLAIHHFDGGHGLNMPLLLMEAKDGFDEENLPQEILYHNMFGRAVRVHRLKEELAEAHTELDRELKVVGDIQRSLLPNELPNIPGFDFGASYETARRAGGDYYDLFELMDGKWGVLIADVSGHGTPAAVLMAVTHALAHGYGGPPLLPSELLNHVNKSLCKGYTSESGTFVTAFYGILDPKTKKMDYAIAGHNPPRLRRTCSTIEAIHEPAGLPLGIIEDETYQTGQVQLNRGDALLLYTDGITEAMSPDGDLFGEERLDRLIRCCDSGSSIIRRINAAVTEHCASKQPTDDRTLVAVRVK